MPSKKESTKVKTQDTTIFFIIAIAIVLTPLIYFKGTNELFEFPKMMFSYFIISTAALFLSVKRLLRYKIVIPPLNAVNTKEILGKLSTLEKGVYLFLLANFVSAVFSILPYTSVFGYYTRFNGGLLSILLWTLLFLIITKIELNNLSSRLQSVAVLSALPVSLYAIYQRLGFEKDLWVEDSQTRVFSTLGQPNWLAAFLVILIPLALKKIMDANKTEAKIAYSALTVLLLSSIWFTYSFSGFLGILGAFVFLIVFTNKEVLLKNRFYLLSVTGIMVLIMILNPGVFKPKLNDSINDVKNKFFQSNLKLEEAKTHEVATPKLDNEGSVNNATSETNVKAPEVSTPKPKFGDTTGIRLTVWKGSINLITSSIKNMLIGTGPETFPYAFLKFRPVGMNLTSEWDFVFNKPHNYYIELLCNLGILGLSAYLFLIKGIYKNVKDQKTVALKAGIFGLFITDAFGWHTVMSSMLLYILIAIIQKDEYEAK